MVLILHKELVMVSDQWTEKAQAREAGGHAPNDQKQIQISSTLINNIGSVHIKCYSHQYSLSFIHLVVNDEVGGA